MKLLTKPGGETQTVAVKVPMRRETTFNPLGLFGIGPITTTREVPDDSFGTLPERAKLKPVNIDFEDADALTTCLEFGAYDHWKRKVSFPLSFEDEIYILHGVVPLKRLRDNVWECSIDFFEY